MDPRGLDTIIMVTSLSPTPGAHLHTINPGQEAVTAVK